MESTKPLQTSAEEDNYIYGGIRDRLRARKSGSITQLGALFRKSAAIQWRQKRTNITQISFPLGMVLLLFLFQMLVDSYLLGQDAFNIPEDLDPAASNTIPIEAFTRRLRNADDCAAYVPDTVALNISDPGFMSKLPNQDIYIVETQPNSEPRVGSYNGFVSFLRSGMLGNMTVSVSVKFGDTVVEAPSGFLLWVYGDTLAGFQQNLCLKKMQFGLPVFNTSFTTVADIQDYQFKSMLNPNPYQPPMMGGIIVKTLKTSHTGKRQFSYTVMANSTLTSSHDVPFFMRIFNAAFLKTATGDTIKFEGFRNVPRAAFRISFDLSSLIGSFLFVYVFQLMLPVILGNMVYEREYRLVEIMRMMGLRRSVYWIVQYMFGFLLYLIAIAVMWIAADRLGFPMFTVNDPLVLIITFFIWGNTLIAFAFFLSTFFERSKTATVVGYFYVFGGGLIASQVVNDYFSNPDTPVGTLYGIQAVPTFALYHALQVLSNNVAFDGPGLRLADVLNPDVKLGTIWIIMLIEWAVFLLLSLYLEEVLPKSTGVQRHPLFFLQPSFWRRQTTEGWSGELVSDLEHEPRDVQAERERVRSDLAGSNEVMLKILDLSKTYPGGCRKKGLRAVDRVALGIENRSCFGFLGPNGAGKTTLISMLCGLFEPTSGGACVGEVDLATGLDLFHAGLGVCPQDNILWDDLTGREHLLFYGRLKNLRKDALKKAVDDALHAVSLQDAGEKRSSEYSGGMKRRLSVACALIGKPLVILLDEPTTGLDPASRRRLWDVVTEYKQHCTVMLTTHSMEEADALCDRLCIMDGGHVRCIGTSAELKSRFGRGYKLTVVGEPTTDDAAARRRDEKIFDFVNRSLAGARLLNTLAGVSNFEVPRESIQLSGLFNLVEDNKADLSVRDWGIAHSTLEEVFLRIVEQGRNSVIVQPGKV